MIRASLHRRAPADVEPSPADLSSVARSLADSSSVDVDPTNAIDPSISIDPPSAIDPSRSADLVRG